MVQPRDRPLERGRQARSPHIRSIRNVPGLLTALIHDVSFWNRVTRFEGVEQELRQGAFEAVTYRFV